MFNHELVAVRRTELGLSQRALGRLLGWNYAVILRMERGAAQDGLTLGQLGKLATALGLEPAALLSPGMLQNNSGIHAIDPELEATQARLLRRIQIQGADRRTVSAADREFVLPNLCKRGLVDARRDLRLTEHCELALRMPSMPVESTPGRPDAAE